MAKLLELPSLSLGDTRWLSILRSISRVLHHYKAIVVALENTAQTESGETSAKAEGYRAFLLSFESLFLLVVIQEILEPLDRLNLGLQASCMGAVDSLVVSKSTIKIVRANDIDRIFQEAVALCKDLEEGELKLQFTIKQTLLSTSLRDQATRYRDAIADNMQERLVDSIAPLAEFLPKVFKF